MFLDKMDVGNLKYEIQMCFSLILNVDRNINQAAAADVITI